MNEPTFSRITYHAYGLFRLNVFCPAEADLIGLHPQRASLVEEEIDYTFLKSSSFVIFIRFNI